MCLCKILKKKKPKSIRHYTNFHYLLMILDGGLKFGEPRDDWDDQNDVYSLKTYGELTHQKVFVICFCGGLGNVHHWFYYGRNIGTLTFGNFYENIKCNIKFNREKLEKTLVSQGFKLQEVKYAITKREKPNKKKHKTLLETLHSKEDLCLIKRGEYDVENEWRVVTTKPEGSNETPPNVVNIIPCIEQIALLVEEDSVTYCLLKKKIECLHPELKGKIVCSGVHKSLNWKAEIDKIVKKL